MEGDSFPSTLKKYRKIMNKKMYFAPECEELILETEGFLAASDVLEDGSPMPIDNTEDDNEDDGLS